MFCYKGYPVVRCDKRIYYGNMWDPFVALIEVTDCRTEEGIEIISKCRLYKISTKELDPVKAVMKRTEKESLFDALDIAYAWISRS